MKNENILIFLLEIIATSLFEKLLNMILQF